jgi:hypothetical protein
MSVKLLSAIKPGRRAEFVKVLRKVYNFCKHSDRDRDTAVDRYNVDSAIWKTFIAILDYESCWAAKTPLMVFFLAWFTSRYPSLVENDLKTMTEQFSVQIGAVADVSAKDALAVLSRFLLQYDDLETEMLPFFRQFQHVEL